MRHTFLFIALCVSLTGCPSASQMLTPGAMNATGAAPSSSDPTSPGRNDGIDATNVGISGSDTTGTQGTPPPQGSPRQGFTIADQKPDDSQPLQSGDPQTIGTRDAGSQPPANARMAMSGTSPIGTKPDGEAVQVGRRHTRFQYGSNFSQTNVDGWASSTAYPLTEWPLNDDGSLEMKLLLENNVVIKESNDPLHVPSDYGWLPQEDGPQIRVVLLPDGRPQWQAKYADAVIFRKGDGSNVLFTGLHPTESGILHFFVIEKPHPGFANFPPPPGFETTSDFNPGDLVKFYDKDAFNAFWDNGTVYLQNENATARRFVGAFHVTAPQRVDVMKAPPPAASTTNQERLRSAP